MTSLARARCIALLGILLGLVACHRTEAPPQQADAVNCDLLDRLAVVPDSTSPLERDPIYGKIWAHGAQLRGCLIEAVDSTQVPDDSSPDTRFMTTGDRALLMLHLTGQIGRRECVPAAVADAAAEESGRFRSYFEWVRIGSNRHALQACLQKLPPPSDAVDCRVLDEIWLIPIHSGTLGVDPAYDRVMREGKEMRSCLIEETLSDRPRRDPSLAPRIQGFTSGDLAFQLLVETGQARLSDCAPPEVLAAIKITGIQNFYDWVHKDRTRLHACLSRL